jgi:hypothetical protein
MTPTSTKVTKVTKKYLATPTTMNPANATPPFTPREADQLLGFAADVAPRFRRLGRLSLRTLDRAGGPLAGLRFALRACRRCAREQEQLLRGEAPFDDPLARLAAPADVQTV